MGDITPVEQSAARIGASNVIDELMHKHGELEISFAYGDQEKLTMQNIVTIVESGTRWKRAAYEEYDNPDIRASYESPELYASSLEERFDEWSEWDDALKALQGQAPVVKAIGLLEKQRQNAEFNKSIYAEDIPTVSLGLSTTKPDDLKFLLELQTKRVTLYDKAVRMVRTDYLLKSVGKPAPSTV